MWETIRGYLTFTRKERFGVLFLLLVICMLFVLPYFFRPAVGDPDPAAYEKMKGAIQHFESATIDSFRESVHHARYTGQSIYSPGSNDKQKKYATESETGPPVNSFHGKMFYFDPNMLNGTEWMRLGLSERLTRTILHYVEKGGRFRRPEDLKKLYGLHEADFQRLFPYVRIVVKPENKMVHPGYNTDTTHYLPANRKPDSFLRGPFRPGDVKPSVTYVSKNYEPTEINLSDSAGWSRLPGIGAKLASRIVHFREKLGGFYQVEQVGETFGLPDSVFQKIKPSLRMNAGSVVQINLNDATPEILQSHPYIRWQFAKLIIAYRRQHGGFHSEEELLQIVQMDPGKFEKIKPYVTVKP
jgi:competence protein ComEA